MTPDQLKEFLSKNRISIIALALKADMSMPTVYSFLNGKKIKQVTIDKLIGAVNEFLGESAGHAAR